MSYILLFIVFIGVMLGYLFIANKSGIIDKPNDRSSHKKPTVRGGGVIFPIAILLWAITFDHSVWYFVVAVLSVGIIGFLDDRYSLPPLPRLVFQSLGVLFVLVELGMLTLPLLYIGIAFIVITGWLNTFNFMDGINGISVLYSASVILGIYLYKDIIPEIQLSLVYNVTLSLIVFGWLNVRKNAVVFAGDVGSLSMGLILAYFVSVLILTTEQWEFIMFFSVYGVDSILTILDRLKNRENIFEAHRSHLYQYLANEMEWPHLIVAVIYSSLQFIIIVVMYFVNRDKWTFYSISIVILLIIIYSSSKVFILNRIQKLNS